MDLGFCGGAGGDFGRNSGQEMEALVRVYPRLARLQRRLDALVGRATGHPDQPSEAEGTGRLLGRLDTDTPVGRPVEVWHARARGACGAF
jgi:hypothetical protein